MAARLHRALLVAALLAVVAHHPVRADDAGDALTLRYAVRWAGVQAADVAVILVPPAADERRFEMRAEIKTRGLARLVTGFRADAVSTGTLDGTRAAAPGTHYDARYRLRGRDKRMSFAMAPTAGRPTAMRQAGDTSKRPELDVQWRRGVFDPLTLIMVFREQVRSGALTTGDRFEIPVYDGRRRFDVVGVVPAPTTQSWNGRTIRAYTVDVELMPRAGFSQAELDGEEDPENIVRPARLVVSADGMAVPLAFSVPAIGLTFDVRLIELCDSRGCRGGDGVAAKTLSKS